MKKNIKTKEEIPDWAREGFGSHTEFQFNDFVIMMRKANGLIFVDTEAIKKKK